MIISTKYCEDRFFKNIQVRDLINLFGIKQTYKYENMLLALLQFDLAIDNALFY